MVDDITADPGDAHLGPLSHSVDKLCEEAACGVLEISQIHFDQQVHVPRVHHFREWMIEPSVLLHLPSLFV